MSSESSSLRMTVSVPNGETGQEILEYLAATDDDDVSFTVDCLVDGGTRPCTLSVDEITPKQWEAAALAVQKGYYKHPKEADLAELAEEMDIS
ncbi:MAG: helix-turn-helix domain-containing protein, partial [Haloferacaceae archaeon]